MMGPGTFLLTYHAHTLPGCHSLVPPSLTTFRLRYPSQTLSLTCPRPRPRPLPTLALEINLTLSGRELLEVLVLLQPFHPGLLLWSTQLHLLWVAADLARSQNGRHVRAALPSTCIA